MDVRLVLIPLLAVGIAWLYWPTLPQSSVSPATSRTVRSAQVLTTRVRLEPQRQVFESIGTARAQRSITLYPAVDGEVVALHFRANQFVEAGDVLLEFDRRDAQLALDLARVRVRDAERTLNRYLRSEGSGAFSASTVDEARTALELAQLEAERAAIRLDDHTLRAPFAGFVGLSAIEIGDRIDTEDAIATLDDRSELLLDVDLPESAHAFIEPEMVLSVQRWDGETLSARVREIDSRVTQPSRRFTVRATVPNATDQLRPGMSFRVVLTLRGMRYPAVPEVALQWGGEGAYLWLVGSEQVAQRVAVDVVQRQPGMVLLRADALVEGRDVIVEGVQRMREGLQVEARTAPEGHYFAQRSRP